MADLATAKPPGPLTARHSAAPEPHSLFCTVYAPPSTASRCELHSAAPPDAPAAAALTGAPAEFRAPTALAGSPPPVTPPTIATTPPRTTTASTATTARAFLLRGTRSPSPKARLRPRVLGLTARSRHNPVIS